MTHEIRFLDVIQETLSLWSLAYFTHRTIENRHNSITHKITDIKSISKNLRFLRRSQKRSFIYDYLWITFVIYRHKTLIKFSFFVRKRCFVDNIIVLLLFVFMTWQKNCWRIFINFTLLCIVKVYNIRVKQKLPFECL